MRMNMSTIDSKRLRDALAKAKNIGLVEETFTLGDCELVLRSLRPDEYTAVLQECQGLNDMEYLHAYQLGHIARAIVGINGLDFHDVQFVEEEEPDPKRPDKMRTVKLELHSYLTKNVLATWSKEAIYTAYRKFGDVVEQAERKAKEGVTFLLPEETEEERYRRLLLEAKELEDSIPSAMVDRVLEEMGLMRKTTADEIKANMEKLDQLARDKEAAEAPAQAPEPVPSPAVVAAASEVEASPEPPKRPVDPHQTLQRAIEARKATPVVVQAAQGDVPSVKRAAAIAALETNVGGVVHEDTLPPSTLPSSHGPIEVYRPDQPQAPVEVKKQEQFDPTAAAAILEQPPAAGINPRFRPPQRV
jgi:hypothetical protein